MNGKVLFDAEGYFSSINAQNNLARENGFDFCTCSGIESLEGALQKYRTSHAFICMDDTNDGSLIRGRSGGWYKNRTMTVFLMHRYRHGDMADRSAKLGLCRELFRQIITKMLVDQNELANDMIYLRTENVVSRELGEWFLNGCTGLYFMVDISEPIDLVYSQEEWTN